MAFSGLNEIGMDNVAVCCVQLAAADVCQGLGAVHGLGREHDEVGGEPACKRTDGRAAVHPHEVHAGHTSTGRLGDVCGPVDTVQRLRTCRAVVIVDHRSRQAFVGIVLAVSAHPVVLLPPPPPRVVGSRTAGATDYISTSVGPRPDPPIIYSPLSPSQSHFNERISDGVVLGSVSPRWRL